LNTSRLAHSVFFFFRQISDGIDPVPMQESLVAAPVLDIGETNKQKKNTVRWQINWFGGGLSEKRSEVCQVMRRSRSRKYILVSLEQTHLWEMAVVTEFLDREKLRFICAENFSCLSKNNLYRFMAALK
jgi:hypothetical protein